MPSEPTRFKSFSFESVLMPAIMCIVFSVSILPAKLSFNTDNVRVCKILGCGLLQSDVIQGMVFKRQVEGDITKVENAKVAVFTCPLDSMQTETKVRETVDS